VRDEAAEGVIEQMGEPGLADRADADRGHRVADLAGRDVLVDVIGLAQRQLRSAPALLRGELEA